MLLQPSMRPSCELCGLIVQGRPHLPASGPSLSFADHQDKWDEHAPAYEQAAEAQAEQAGHPAGQGCVSGSSLLGLQSRGRPASAPARQRPSRSGDTAVARTGDSSSRAGRPAAVADQGEGLAARQAIASLLQPIGSAPQRQRHPGVGSIGQQLATLEQLARGCLTEDWEGQGKGCSHHFIFNVPGLPVTVSLQCSLTSITTC